MKRIFLIAAGAATSLLAVGLIGLGGLGGAAATRLLPTGGVVGAA